MTKILAVDNAVFDKAAKKFHQSLEQSSDLTLSKTRELLSQALGFKNYHGLQTYFNKPKLKEEKSANVLKNQYWLKKLNNENIVSLTSCLLKHDDMWADKALILLKTVLSLLDVLKIEKNAENLENFIKFDTLYKIYESTQSEEVKKIIFDYGTNCLPGFNQSSNITASEQNSYLSSQLVMVTKLFKQVENHDFLMFSFNWLRIGENQDMTLKLFNDLYVIKNNGLSSMNNWESFFEKILPLSPPFNNIKFRSNIINSEAYQDSWLCDPAFVSVMTSKLLTKKYENFYFSDFLLSISKIINNEKKQEYLGLIKNMKNNYNSCVSYSEELNNS